MSDITLNILGAAGRMGRMLVATATQTPGLRVVAAVEQDGNPEIGNDAGLLAGVGPLGVPVTDAASAPAADVVIDFTFHTATPGNLANALAKGAKTCPFRKKCSTIAMWTEYDKLTKEFFGKRTIADLT